MIRFASPEWEGLDGMGAEILRSLRSDAEHEIRWAGQRFTNIIKKTLTGRRSGRTYRVSRTGALHVASAPGEPPAVLFGNLRNSVGYSDPRWEGGAISTEVGPGLGQSPSGQRDPAETYARRLEYGGVDSRGVMIEARPYMEPSAQKAEAEIDARWRRVFGS